MDNVRRETWKRYDIGIQAIPVQRILVRHSVPKAYVAVVKIAVHDEVFADWHLPFYAERWRSKAEAERDALDYAVKLIDSGVFEPPDNGAKARAAA